MALTTCHGETVTVAAASDLKFALEEVSAAYTEQTGKQVQLVFGSSGNFYRQIRQGAPFQIYLSADEAYVERLHEAGLTFDSFIYGIGRLVYFAPHNGVLRPSQGIEDLENAVVAGKVQRFAIANPDHAPYGRAAMQALETLKIAESLRPHLVLGENVSQAAQFALSGATDGGLFAYSLALSPKVAAKGRFVLVPAELHQPLRQRAALLKTAGHDSRAFYRYLNAKPAREILARYGFSTP